MVRARKENMAIDTEQATRDIVNTLSLLIASEMRALSSEYWQPRFQSDQMDAELKFRRERIDKWRTMRAECESIAYGMTSECV
jgi:hypothetical protein